jgi:UDP-glucose 4-epimerase
VKRAFVAGGAGFIGSHLVRALLEDATMEVVAYDNLVSGSRSRLEEALADPRATLVVGDIEDIEQLGRAMAGCDQIYHFAANPDIARAMTDPTIDFWQGTRLTSNVVEAARTNGASRITFASGSGVYGDQGALEVDETFGPLVPISTYGASKLGCESLLAAYSHMFGLQSVAFRFANVVGPAQTHGVTFDFVRRLRADPTRLRILGDGSQSKSYIHVTDVVSAMLTLNAQNWEGFDVFNVGTDDYITVSEIADLVVDRMGLRDVSYEYTGGTRGWKGDVPVVRFRSEKLRSLGWRNAFSSRQALIESIDANIAETAAVS